MSEGPIIYDPATDTMLVELRPWPGGPNDPRAGGQDAGDGLVIHDAADGRPWAWEIEHASRHPELLGDTLRAMGAARGAADAA